MANQTKVAVFTGSEPYIDLTWDTQYTSFINLGSAPATTDSTIPGISLCNPSNPAIAPDNAGVRVVPTAPFSGSVPVLNMEVIS